MIHKAFVQGVSTCKIEKLVRSMGIENLSCGQISEMTKGRNKQVLKFRSLPLADMIYPVALYEKARVDRCVVSMAVLVLYEVNDEGRCEVLTVEPMLEESEESYFQVFQSLRQRGLKDPSLVASDANRGLASTVRKSFPRAS